MSDKSRTEKNTAFESAEKQVVDHSGHRQRLLSKLQTGGLCYHEYLEVILFWALPRRNTNDVAHRLLAEFGSVRGIFSAPIEQLSRIDGIGKSAAQFLFTIGEFLRVFSKPTDTPYPQSFDLDQFAAFIKGEYASLGYEVLDVYVLDDAGKIYGRRRQTSLREKKVEVHLRWLMNVLLDFNPSGVVIVHNHPCGEAKPSEADDRTTAECRSLCEKNGVVLCDHFIYSPQGIYSYNLSRQLKERETVGNGFGGERG